MGKIERTPCGVAPGEQVRIWEQNRGLRPEECNVLAYTIPKGGWVGSINLESCRRERNLRPYGTCVMKRKVEAPRPAATEDGKVYIYTYPPTIPLKTK